MSDLSFNEARWHVAHDLRAAVGVIQLGHSHLEGCSRRHRDDYACDCGMERLNRAVTAFDAVAPRAAAEGAGRG